MEATTKRTAYAISLLVLLGIFLALEVLRYHEESLVHAELHPLETVARILFAASVAWFWWRDRNATTPSDSADVWFLLFLLALTYR